MTLRVLLPRVHARLDVVEDAIQDAAAVAALAVGIRAVRKRLMCPAPVARSFTAGCCDIGGQGGQGLGTSFLLSVSLR